MHGKPSHVTWNYTFYNWWIYVVCTEGFYLFHVFVVIWRIWQRCRIKKNYASLSKSIYPSDKKTWIEFFIFLTSASPSNSTPTVICRALFGRRCKTINTHQCSTCSIFIASRWKRAWISLLASRPIGAEANEPGQTSPWYPSPGPSASDRGMGEHPVPLRISDLAGNHCKVRN